MFKGRGGYFAARLTHLELQRSAALGWLAHTVDGKAAVLAVVRLPGVRDEEHLAVFPGHVALMVPGNGGEGEGGHESPKGSNSLGGYSWLQ